MKYSLRKNNLTSPVSFRPIVDITSVLDLNEISGLINQKVPTITQDEIVQALVAFKNVSLDQLLAGNALNITNFFSVRPSIRKGKLNLNFEIIPECSKCVAKVTIAKGMIADAKIRATFSFSGETTEGKTSSTTTVPGTGTIDSCGIPQPGDPDVNVTALAKIIQVYSMPYGIDNHIHNDSGLIIVGENLVFDPDIPDSGIWIKSANNTSRLQSDIISIAPKTVRVVGEVDFTGGPAGTNSVEHILWLSRINSLGVQKITNFSGFIRKTNYVTQENNQLFITGSQTEGPLSVREFSGSEDLYEITCYKYSGKIRFTISDLSNEKNSTVFVNNDGDTLQLQTNNGIVKVDVNSISTLFENITLYGGFIREIAQIGAIEYQPPILYEEYFNGFSEPLPEGWNSTLSDDSRSSASIFFDQLDVKAQSSGSIEYAEVTNEAFLFPVDQNWTFNSDIIVKLEPVSSGSSRFEITLGSGFIIQLTCFDTPQNGNIRFIAGDIDETSATPFTWSAATSRSQLFNLEISNINGDLVVSYDTGEGQEWLGGPKKVVSGYFNQFTQGSFLVNHINVYSSRSIFQIAEAFIDNYIVTGD